MFPGMLLRHPSQIVVSSMPCCAGNATAAAQAISQAFTQGGGAAQSVANAVAQAIAQNGCGGTVAQALAGTCTVQCMHMRLPPVNLYMQARGAPAGSRGAWIHAFSLPVPRKEPSSARYAWAQGKLRTLGIAPNNPHVPEWPTPFRAPHSPCHMRDHVLFCCTRSGQGHGCRPGPDPEFRCCSCPGTGREPVPGRSLA